MSETRILNCNNCSFRNKENQEKVYINKNFKEGDRKSKVIFPCDLQKQINKMQPPPAQTWKITGCNLGSLAKKEYGTIIFS